MLKGNCEIRGIKFGFANAFIVILSLSAILVGPISEASAKSKTSPTTSFLRPSTKIDTTHVGFIGHSHKHSHGVSDPTPTFTPHSPSAAAASLPQPTRYSSLSFLTPSTSPSTNASLIQIGKIQDISFTINNN